jgi:DNA-binding CsgD family transcriptional regulator
MSTTDDDVPESVLNWQANLKQRRLREKQRSAEENPASRPSLSLPLSAREAMVAKLFADDHSSDQIALVLGLSPETVRAYLRRAREKIANGGRDATNKLQLRARLVEDGLLSE